MYNADEFRKSFTQTDLYKTLCKDFDEVCFDKHFPEHPLIKKRFKCTPRQVYADHRLSKTIFSAVPFYYIDFIQQNNPSTIYDLGCGWNIFKKYIPNIVGVGAELPDHYTFYADIHDLVDDEFVAGHQDYYEAFISIDALHFIPLQELRQKVLGWYSMLAPGGRAWIALNAYRMIERDADFVGKPVEEIFNYIQSQLVNLPVKYLHLDVDLSCIDSWMDGNIQIIFEKPLIKG